MFKISQGQIKNFFRTSNLRNIFFGFFTEWSKALILLVAITGTLCCVWIWYALVYNPSWSETQIEAYKKTKDTGIVFDKAKFEDVVLRFKSRQAQFQKSSDNLTDIFRLKQ